MEELRGKVLRYEESSGNLENEIERLRNELQEREKAIQEAKAQHSGGEETSVAENLREMLAGTEKNLLDLTKELEQARKRSEGYREQVEELTLKL